MGKTFRKIHISLAGDFGPMSEKIKQWVEAKKDATTHLIATKDAFRKHDAAGRSPHISLAFLILPCPVSSAFRKKISMSCELLTR